MAERSFTFEQAQRYLLSLELFGMRFGLERMRRLMTALGSPHERFASIHVVGTNGKSSTARMVAAILRRHGLFTGAYLSPHLASFAERIEVREQAISPERFAAAVSRAAAAATKVNRTLAADDHVTQFEALTAAAYWELARAGVDVAVIEAGLGGRYDATSVIESRVQVLTNISLEHTRWLGPTERHIAEEKLAVVRPKATLVSGPLGPEALAVARHAADDRAADLLLFGEHYELSVDGRQRRFSVRTRLGAYEGIELRPLGAFQRRNFAVAVAAAEAYIGRRLEWAGVRSAALELTLPGRLEVVSADPLVIFDGAHNPEGARALRESLPAVVGERRLSAVVSVLDDKDAAGILSELLPLCGHAIFTRSERPNSLPPATLQSLWRQLGGQPAEVVSDPAEALRAALASTGPGGAVLVTGSIYLLSELVASPLSFASDERDRPSPRAQAREREEGLA